MRKRRAYKPAASLSSSRFFISIVPRESLIKPSSANLLSILLTTSRALPIEEAICS
jgi:hypothetical protein